MADKFNVKASLPSWLFRDPKKRTSAPSPISTPAPAPVVSPIPDYVIKPMAQAPNINHPAIQAAMKTDPRLAKNIQTLYDAGDDSLDLVLSAIQTGNYTGMPFTAADAEAELSRQRSILDPYYTEERSKATSDFKADLKKAKADYEAENAAKAGDFMADKEAADVDAANKGVLFSTGRVQKLNALQSKYAADQAARLRNLEYAAGKAGREYQYKYGNDATRGLSSYFGVGGNTFDALSSGGRVGSSGLSSIYNPSNYDYVGSKRKEQEKEAILRTGTSLKARGNKLLPYSINYQL